MLEATKVTINIKEGWWTPARGRVVCLLCGTMPREMVPNTVLGFIEVKWSPSLPKKCKTCMNSQALCG